MVLFPLRSNFVSPAGVVSVESFKSDQHWVVVSNIFYLRFGPNPLPALGPGAGQVFGWEWSD